MTTRSNRTPPGRLLQLFGALVACVIAGAAPAQSPAGLVYPPARLSTQVDTYHGVRVADPYRWMEDVDAPETRAWVEAQAKLTSDYLAAIPGRERISERLRQIWNYERWSPPEQHGGRWFYDHNDGLQNQSVLYSIDRGDGEPRLVLDPNKLSKDGTVAFKGAGFSDDGRLMAYGLSEAGSDWETWRVRDLTTGVDLPDEVHHAKFTQASFRKDGSGFYYAGYDISAAGESLKAQNEYHTLYFHRLGTAQSADARVYRNSDDPDWEVGGTVSDDGRYLVVSSSRGTDTRNVLLVADLAHGGKLKPVIPKPTASYAVIGNLGSTFYVLTDDGAPRYRVVAIDVAHPAPERWKTVIPESQDLLDHVTLAGHQLIAQFLKDAHSVVVRYGVDGRRLGEVALPGLGTAQGFSGLPRSTCVYYQYSDYTTPAAIYRLDLTSGTTSLWKSPRLSGFASADYETRQVFYASKDGTRVPMFITARKGMKLDGTNPTMLWGYGGFNISEQPGFSPSVAVWLEMGGVYAVANLRGGGEYGRVWHEGGMKVHKQNVFDDFIAAAQYLIAGHWTSAERLAIRGGSNGGLLIGAVEQQRPELFAAAIAQVGVMDMMRFREFTIGKAWESDYGTVDDEAEFRAMLAYSPVHNARAGVDYPATLVMTGDHDDRVYPAHSFKFAAAMQAADPHGHPILIRIDQRAGHGQGKPVAKRVEETADMYLFALHAMGLAR